MSTRTELTTDPPNKPAVATELNSFSILENLDLRDMFKISRR